MNCAKTVLPEGMDSFKALLDRASSDDPSAIEALSRQIYQVPDLLFYFGRCFTDPLYHETTVKILRHSAFDLSPLQSWFEKNPPALMVLAGLAQGGNEAAQRILPKLQLNPKIYQEAVQGDPDFLPYLVLMAEEGHRNIAELLAHLVWGGDDLILSSMVGIAAEGSPAAFTALNMGVTAGQLTTLLRFAELYGDDPACGGPLQKVLESPAFRPVFLSDAEEIRRRTTPLEIFFKNFKDSSPSHLRLIFAD